MPELPEVEVARRHLEQWTRDRAIVRARVPKSRVIGEQSPAAMVKFLVGRRIEAVDRKGKSMMARLSREGALFLHLGMSGQILLAPEQGRHVRLELELEEGARVLFDDPRMFGRVAVGPWKKMEKKYFDPLGLDPMSDRFSPEDLGAILERSKRPIKLLLMDQARIAGVGNIYASEALWLAKIDPRMAANAIDARHAKSLHAAIRRAMGAAILRLEEGEKYLSAGGENRFQIYGREGERCKRCHQRIERYELGGRSTYWCRMCQRGRRSRSTARSARTPSR